VVAARWPVSIRDTRKYHNEKQTTRKQFQAHAAQDFSTAGEQAHPMLVVNMSVFNFTDGWSRTFSKYEYVRFYA
jgi:hypothetical protein